MARRKRGGKGKNSSVISVDLSDVESRVLLPEDDYRLKPTKITREEGDAADYLKWEFEVIDGKYEGHSPWPYSTSLAPQALWNLRGLLEALGYDIPDSAFDLDLEDLCSGEYTVVGTVEHDSYNGRKQARIVDFAPDDEAEEKPKGKKAKDEEEEEEEPKGKKGRGKKGKAKETELVSQDDVQEMDEDELAEFVEEHELDVDLDRYKTLRKKRAAVIDAGVEAEVVEDE